MEKQEDYCLILNLYDWLRTYDFTIYESAEIVNMMGNGMSLSKALLTFNERNKYEESENSGFTCCAQRGLC